MNETRGNRVVVMKEETVHDFGNDFGTLTRQEIECAEKGQVTTQEKFEELMSTVKEALELLTTKV